MLPRSAYKRPKPLADLFWRVRHLAAQNGDPLLAAFEVIERLSQEQAEEMYALVWAEGAPLRCGGLGFSPAETDLLQLLAARLGHPLTWEHVYAGPHGGMRWGKGRYVEEIAT